LSPTSDPPTSDFLSRLKLDFVKEAETFTEVAGAEALLEAPPPGGGLRWSREAGFIVYAEALQPWLQGRVGGGAQSRWREGGPISVGETELCRIGPCWWLPQGGALIGLDGRTPAASLAEVGYNRPQLDPLVGVAPEADGFVFTPPADAPSLGEACIALPWGAVNYGHFVLEGLTSVLAMHEAGLLDKWPLATPKLKPWQRELLSLGFGDLNLLETSAPIARLDGAVFCLGMDHYLNRPGPLALRLRARYRAAAATLPPPRRRKRKLYVSRRGNSMRVMVNETALEAALVRRGFEIIRPERMKAADQLACFAQAEVIVGASGAGLTNAVFAPEGCHVLEIQPENFASFWVPAFCRLAGLNWAGYITPSPCARTEAPLLTRLRKSFRFAYRLNVPDVLAFLEARL
jgi:capsular polysaccharide biosynthesis protein